MVGKGFGRFGGMDGWDRWMVESYRPILKLLALPGAVVPKQLLQHLAAPQMILFPSPFQVCAAYFAGIDWRDSVWGPQAQHGVQDLVEQSPTIPIPLWWASCSALPIDMPLPFCSYATFLHKFLLFMKYKWNLPTPLAINTDSGSNLHKSHIYLNLMRTHTLKVLTLKNIYWQL